MCLRSWIYRVCEWSATVATSRQTILWSNCHKAYFNSHTAFKMTVGEQIQQYNKDDTRLAPLGHPCSPRGFCFQATIGKPECCFRVWVNMEWNPATDAGVTQSLLVHGMIGFNVACWGQSWTTWRQGHSGKRLLDDVECCWFSMRPIMPWWKRKAHDLQWFYGVVWPFYIIYYIFIYFIYIGFASNSRSIFPIYCLLVNVPTWAPKSRSYHFFWVHRTLDVKAVVNSTGFWRNCIWSVFCVIEPDLIRFK